MYARTHTHARMYARTHAHTHIFTQRSKKTSAFFSIRVYRIIRAFFNVRVSNILQIYVLSPQDSGRTSLQRYLRLENRNPVRKNFSFHWFSILSSIRRIQYTCTHIDLTYNTSHLRTKLKKLI